MAFVDNTTGGRIVPSAGPTFKLTVKASSTVNPGDAVGYNAGWVAADADAIVQPEFVAVGRSTGGDEISVTRRAEIDFGTGCTATAHDAVYMGSTAGVYAASAVASYGLAVGRMLSAQIGLIDLTAQGAVTPGATITQTYATTAGTLSQSAAAVGTTAATNSSPYGYSSAAQADAIRSQLNQVITDLQATDGVLNVVVNTLKTAGLLSN